MTGPTRAPATLAADLAAMERRASRGPWMSVPGAFGDPANGPDHMRVTTADYQNAHDAIATLEYDQQGGVDADYIAALENAHRAGHLVTLDAALDWVAEQLADPEVVAAAYEGQADAGQVMHDGLWITEQGLAAALAALRDRAASRAPQPDTTHDTKEQP